MAVEFRKLAVLLAQQKRYREALTHFAAVAKQDAGRADVEVGQAEMLRNLGDINASIPHWRRATELDPANAVAWLANKLAEFDVGLNAGEVILPGALSAAITVQAGDTVRATFDRLGAVSVRFS